MNEFNFLVESSEASEVIRTRMFDLVWRVIVVDFSHLREGSVDAK